MALLVDGSVLPSNSNDIGILLFGGVLSLLGQMLTTVALKMESAGKVALTLKSSQILFSFMFQILLFDVSYHINLLLNRTEIRKNFNNVFLSNKYSLTESHDIVTIVGTSISKQYRRRCNYCNCPTIFRDEQPNKREIEIR
jgi:hypothetical protein